VNELSKVTRARLAKDAAALAFVSALDAAHRAGHTYAEVARAAGVSRQAVRQALEGRTR
jgi:predicted transcriptional regulator